MRRDLPACEHVRIEKHRSRSGIVRVLNELGDWRQFPFNGSLPFSKSDLFAEYSAKNRSDGNRVTYLEEVVIALIQAIGSDRHPIRFKDAEGVAWKGDKGAVPRLVESGRFRLEGDDIVWLDKPEEAKAGSLTAADELTPVRQRAYYERLMRPEQAKLRAELLRRFESCCLSGCSTEWMLEAAHIVPVKDGGYDTTSNAILLRADLHRLFDLGLLRINPSDGSLSFCSRVNQDDVDPEWRYDAANDLPPFASFRSRWDAE